MLFSTSMKIILTVLLIVPFVTFSQSKAFVPLEYEYPSEVLSTPKTYVYKNLATSQLNYKDLSRHDEYGKVTIIWKDYGGDITDSCVEVNDKAIDHYMILAGRYFKGEQNEDSTYQNGTRLGEKKQSECFGINASLQICGIVNSHFLKDTLITWENKRVETLVIESIARVIFRNPSDTIQRKETVGTTFYYFGKSIGLMRYSTIGEGKSEIWELKEIKEQ
jgi:hypothetical protein